MAGGALIGGIAGGIIGLIVSGGNPIGFQIGFMAGAIAGRIADPPDPVKGARLNDLTVSSSAYGAVIPQTWGRTRLPGNLIWSTGLVEYEETTGDKMKGGEFINYKYKASFAMAFCLGPVDEVSRIWADGQLVFDNTSTDERTSAQFDGTDANTLDKARQRDFSSTVSVPGLRFRFYKGAEDQLPDPSVIAKEGEANAPAHRGLCYIVFEDAPLERFGNRIPNVSAEIISTAEKTLVTKLYTDSTALTPTSMSSNLAVDWSRQRSYWIGGTASGAALYIANDDTRADIQAKLISSLFVGQPTSPDSLSSLTIAPGGNLYGKSDDDVYCLDADTLKVRGFFGGVGGGNWIYNNSNMVMGDILAFKVADALGTGREFILSYYGGIKSQIRLLADSSGSPEYVFGAYRLNGVGDIIKDTPVFRFAGSLSNQSGMAACVGKHLDAKTEVWVFNWGSQDGYSAVDIYKLTASLVSKLVVTSDAAFAMGVEWEFVGTLESDDVFGTAGTMAVAGVNFDQTDDSLIMWISGSAGTRTIKWSENVGIVWNEYHGLGGNTPPLARITAPYYGWFDGGSTWRLIDTKTGALLSSGTYTQALISSQAWESTTRSIIAAPYADRPRRARFFLDRIEASEVKISTIVSDICKSVNLTEQDFDASPLTGTVPGFVVGSETRRQALEQLAAAYQFDGIESDWKLKFRLRGGATVATIDYSEIVKEGDEAALPYRRAQELEIPRRMGVNFRNIDRDQQTDVAYWTRRIDPVPIVSSVGEMTVDMGGLVVTPSRAKTIAKRLSLSAWAEREKFDAFRLTPRRIDLEPGDPVTLTLKDGSTTRIRLTQVEIGADFSVIAQAVQEDAIAYSVTATADGGDGFVDQTVPAPYATRLMVTEAPLLADTDDTGTALLYYAGAGGYAGQTWRGATLFSRSGASDWQRVASLTTAASWGTSVNALAAPHSPYSTDRTNTLTVLMEAGAGSLVSITEAQMLSGGNQALLIAANGDAEVIHFQTVTTNADGTRTLSNLLRGRRGSEHVCAGHASGDLFVLTSGSLFHGALGASALGSTVAWKAVGQTDSFDDAPTFGRTITGASQKPYAVVHVAGSRDGSGNLTATWIRRTRLGGSWLNGTGYVALGESSEAYEAEVLNGSGAVVRAITGLTAATLTYTAAQQTTDFGSQQASVTLRVYQMSALVGRGYPSTATV